LFEEQLQSASPMRATPLAFDQYAPKDSRPAVAPPPRKKKAGDPSGSPASVSAF
jgi:hypothetical protein